MQRLVLKIELVPYLLGDGAFACALGKHVGRVIVFPQRLQHLLNVELQRLGNVVLELRFEYLVVSHEFADRNAVLFYEI
jgi:hypothetical protein